MKDPDAIALMRVTYLWGHSVCAYCSTVPKSEYQHCNHERFEVEHIWQRMGGKIDDPLNYVICCRPSHEWKHAHSVCGRIAAMYWKWTHGEFDRDRLRSLIGMDPVGWTSNRRSDGLPDWCDKLAGELITAHESPQCSTQPSDAGSNG
jgi:hypothetical protein